MRRRYGGRPPGQRDLSYDQAVGDEYEPWRLWLDEQLGLLPERTGDVIASKLWRDQFFWGNIIELGAGAAVRAAGMTAQYERAWGPLTPDWTVAGPDGEPVALVEVLTDSPTNGTYGQMRAWHDLVERIKAIPVPVVLALAPGDGPPAAPDSRTSKRIARDLRNYLMSPLVRTSFTSHGYTFLAQADRRGGAMRAPGMQAIFVPPSGLAGHVTAAPLVERIEGKVKKYRALAAQLDLPLIVAAGAHRFTGLELTHLDNLLAGKNSFTIQFNYGDTYMGRPIEFNLGRPARWVMPKELAGVLWIDNQFPFGPTWRPNTDTLRPAPSALTEAWSSQHD